ncbi:hypothetical protein [Paracoccus yeei]|uniref:hypothetical protein n=1 Tax=Paracoccus yeei TaxID=147645 RepID=UPI0012FE34FE|nr:hypothetical protein [Paracoccus yeei]
MDLWSIIKWVGSLGGWVSAVFLVWDRTTQTRPYARFLRDDEHRIPEQNRVFLRVYNPSNRVMLAKVVDSERPQDLYLTPDDETFERSDVTGTMLIKPDGFLDMHVMRPDSWKNLPRDKSVQAIFKWKYAQPVVIRQWRTTRTAITKQDFDSISPS